jgi:hypothetical protein
LVPTTHPSDLLILLFTLSGTANGTAGAVAGAMWLGLLAAASISVQAGAYGPIDRAESAYDGPEVDVRGRVGVHGPWAFVSEMGTAGEFAGGRGTCLGEVAFRMGGSWTVRPGIGWLELGASAGLGLAFVRLYGALFGQTANSALDAAADRWLPQAWLSLEAAADVTRALSLVVAADARALPATLFHPDHLPPGMSADFYPVYRREHDFSTLGATLGLRLRF